MAIQQTATNQFKAGMPSGQYNFLTGTFYIALYTGAATLNATTSAYTSTNEVVGSGYTAGGQALSVSVTPTTGGDPNNTIAYLSFNNITWSPASFTCRGALIYQYDGVNNYSVCVLDFGNDKTCNSQFTVQFPTPTSTNAIIRIA